MRLLQAPSQSFLKTSETLLRSKWHQLEALVKVISNHSRAPCGLLWAVGELVTFFFHGFHYSNMNLQGATCKWAFVLSR